MDSVDFFFLILCGWGGESQSCFEVLFVFVLSLGFVPLNSVINGRFQEG